MAFAEARAAWQRTANRCLVQEDAKRAPKLACCPSVTPSVKHPETEPPNPDNTQEDILTTFFLPFNLNPTTSNLSPTSRWWLQTQPNYGYRQVMAGEQLTTPLESQDLKLLKEGSEKIEDSNVGSCEFSKNSDDVCFDSEKNAPWWRTADTEELALLVAQSSHDVLDNCDLPRPQSARIGMSSCFSCDENSTLLRVQKAGIEHHSHVCSRDSRQGCSLAGYSCQKLRKSADVRLVLGVDKISRNSPIYKKTGESESDTSRAQLLEALRHSQTRAREAEEVMKRACSEKEHVVRLVLRQASQIFAYKQWVHFLQLENTYFQFKNSKDESGSSVSAVTSPNCGTSGNGKMRKSRWLKCSNRKRAKKARDVLDAGKYAIVFALGLGLVGAGLLLGWTIGWMLPTC
ncbi:phospho-N-acetylmuramoyl-pentapeptide-transferase [Striga asiatica]|uniref:Phospho-N-acetylmuramoyl-pentapeptide-transferase n=1 Tax=Striga asiatica TaxID=4170 RepID=A0A5A7PX23_STRAF|nr:phospho-N-acetylmuramoyl-pentapeptide-transferase [Striga asiatica]